MEGDLVRLFDLDGVNKCGWSTDAGAPRVRGTAFTDYIGWGESI